MPIISFKGPDDEDRKKKINKLLPKTPLISKYIENSTIIAIEKTIEEAWKLVQDSLLLALKEEIEIYKAYPKKGTYDINSFDTRTTDSCFMGQGFHANGSGLEGWYDADLIAYRKAMGTITHPEWGQCTLLEVWGADHYTNYKDMVVDVMRYCWGELDSIPDIQIHIDPLHKNSKTGIMIPSKTMKEQERERKRIEYIMHYSEVKLWMKKHRVKNPLGFELDDITDDDIKNIPSDDDDEDDDEDD